MATITPGGSALALLEQTWRPTLATQANEEMRIANTFDDGNEGVSRFANQLNVRKILRIPSTTLGASTAGTGLTYTANTEVNVPVTPTFAYGAVEISRQTLTRLLADKALQAAYRKQIAAGLATKVDADAGQQASLLTTTIKGGIAQTADKNFLLDGIGALIEQARDLYEPGNGGWAYLHYTPRQYKYVHAINEIINAQVRGDGEQVIRKGWVWDAYGLALSETGNVYSAAGIAHNLLHIRQSHVVAYNAKPDFLSPQEFELVIRLIAFVEYGVGKVWDEYAVDMQTTAA